MQNGHVEAKPTILEGFEHHELHIRGSNPEVYIRLVCHYLLSVSDTYILNYPRRLDWSRLHRFGCMHGPLDCLEDNSALH